MLIKVCGMRDPDNIRAVAETGVDLMGFIFWPKSPRVAPFQPPSSWGRPDLGLGSHVKKIGVFVDEKPENVIARTDDYHLDYIQLHGNESPAYIDTLRQLLVQSQDRCGLVRIIKAISIREADDVNRWREYEGHADMLLFDTKCKCVGGSGEQFDWSVLQQYDGDMPFLLSGGIGPDDAERIQVFFAPGVGEGHHPRCIGIDLNSRFEDAPGLKNVEKLRNFIKTIRNE